MTKKGWKSREVCVNVTSDWVREMQRKQSRKVRDNKKTIWWWLWYKKSFSWRRKSWLQFLISPFAPKWSGLVSYLCSFLAEDENEQVRLPRFRHHAKIILTFTALNYEKSSKMWGGGDCLTGLRGTSNNKLRSTNYPKLETYLHIYLVKWMFKSSSPNDM